MDPSAHRRQTVAATPAGSVFPWGAAPDQSDPDDLFDEQTTAVDIPLESTIEPGHVLWDTPSAEPTVPLLGMAEDTPTPDPPRPGRTPIAFNRSCLPGQPRLPPHVRWAAPAPRAVSVAKQLPVGAPDEGADASTGLVVAAVIVGSGLGIVASVLALWLV